MKLNVDLKKRLSGFALDVHLEVENGIIGLLGASGSGKTMTLRCIAGLITPDKGSISVNGNTFFDSEMRVNIRPGARKIGYVFQNYALFPHLTLRDNIAFGLDNVSRQAREEIVNNMLERYRLRDLGLRYPAQLSGGQQQRAALARVMALEPEVLLLDEPFSALDGYLRQQLVHEMQESLQGYSGCTILVTHSFEEAYHICDKLAIMSEGSLHAFDRKERIFASPPTRETAWLTGCRNVIPVKRDKVDQSVWRIPSGQMIIPVAAIENYNSGYLGIRSQYIELKDGVNETNCNVYKVQLLGFSRGPSSSRVYFSLDAEGISREEVSLELNMDNESLDHLLERHGEYYIYLPQDKLFFMV